MKLGRLGLILLVLLLLLGSGWWWWTHRAVPGAADYLPENVSLFIQAPDLGATRQAYETSYLKKVIESREITGLVSMAWKEVSSKTTPENKQRVDTAGQVWDLFQRNLTGAAFVAVTSVDFENPEKVSCVAGLRPKQGLGDIAPLVDRIKKEMGEEGMKEIKTGKGKHGDIDYEWLDLEGKAKLCMAAVGPWQIVSVGEPALFDFMDRYQSKGKNPGALSQNERYKEVLSRFKGSQDAVLYMNFDQMGDKLTSLLEKQSQTRKTAAGLKNLWKQIKGIGWGVKFEDGRIHETIVSLMPKATRPDLGKMYEPCAFKTLSMTGPQTYLYMAQNIDLPKYWNYTLGLYEDMNPQAAEVMKRVPEQAKAMGLDFNKNVLNALGNEYAILADWPGDTLFPDVAFVIDVINPADFKPTMDTLLNALSPMLAASSATLTVEDGKVGAYGLKVFRYKQTPMISPTLIVSGDKFGVFLTETGAKRMLGNTGPTLAADTVFTTLGGNDTTGVASLLYVNTGGLLDRAYQTAKPYVGLAAMMSPEAQKLLGSGKLPDKLSFTGDLGGFLMKTRLDDAGSVGDILSNAGNLPLTLGVASGVAIPVLQQLGKKVDRTKTAVNAKAAGGLLDANGEPTAEGIKAELDELRAVIEAYAVAQDIPKGTVVTWTAISAYLVPDSPLEKNGGKDPLGNLYVLGAVGGPLADVAPETKAKFPDHDENFWNPASPQAEAASPAPAVPTPSEAPATPAPTPAPANP